MKSAGDYSLANDLMDKLKDQYSALSAGEEFKSQLLATNSARPSKFAATDWKFTEFYKNVSEHKITKFNANNDPQILTYELLEYTINLLRYCEKDFKSIESIKPVFEKAASTLEHLMKEIQVSFLFERVMEQVEKINVEETLKILVRIKLLY